MNRYNLWATELMHARPRLGGLLMVAIGGLSLLLQVALLRLFGSYSRLGLLLTPGLLPMGGWFGVLGRPFARGAKPPPWFSVGLWVLLAAALSVGATLASHPERLLR
jgi:hypothetical protein